jgi:hypothetical protein
VETFSALWLIVGLAFFFVAPLTLWLPFYMAAKARGIERALWAVVSQLQALRREEHEDLDPAATRRARAAAAPTGMISTSMFGR